jgi:lysozyme
MPIVPVIADMNHANSVNFSKLKGAGIWGIIHKARQGVGFADPAYTRRRGIAEGLGLLWAAYDFATGDDVQANVDAFLKTANPSDKTGMWLDFEDNSVTEMSADQAYLFLDMVDQRLGRACGIYGGNRIREQIPPDDPKWIDMARVTPLWQARYINARPKDTAALFRVITPIPPWTVNTIIQYTGDGSGPPPHTLPGLEDGADLNAFNGSYNQLTAIWPGAAVPAAVAER